jgi:hypothetical protein
MDNSVAEASVCEEEEEVPEGQFEHEDSKILNSYRVEKMKDY